MSKKIVVTGIGASSPLGGTASESWEALLAGESGIRTLEQEWVAKYELPVTLAEGDRVRAVLLASGVNSAGRTIGLSLPNGEAQAALMERVMREAGVEPEQFGYFEAHGTGTSVNVSGAISSAKISRNSQVVCHVCAAGRTARGRPMGRKTPVSRVLNCTAP